MDNDSKTPPPPGEQATQETKSGADKSRGSADLAVEQSGHSQKDGAKVAEEKAPQESDKASPQPDTEKQAAKPGHKPDRSSPAPQATARASVDRHLPAKKKSSVLKKFLYLIILLGLAVGGYYGWRHYGESLQDKFFSSTPSASISVSSGGDAAKSAADQTKPAASEPDSQLPEVSAGNSVEGVDGTELGTEDEPGGNPVADRLAQLEAQLGDAQLRLNSHQQRLQALSTTTREDWLLAEAEYLLRLANQRILTERQTANALSLMVTADDILKEIDDPDLFPVRRALAADITSVKLAGVVDREGIYLRLDALIGAIPNLKMPLREPAVAAEASPAANIEPWYITLIENAKSALVKMSGIVRVERVDVPLEPVLLPSEQQLLHLNLRMALEQAQLALMREEPRIYKASLGRAQDYIENRFSDAAPTTVFGDELRALAEEKISQPVPALSGSINALQDYIRVWHHRYSVGEQGQPSAESSSETVEADTGVAQ